MSAVFDRYPAGGGEMLLALALADHAHDDGTHIYPYVASLAAKTRQSQRAVQYALRKLQATGWLIADGPGDGGRGRARAYRISPEWLAGGAAVPPAGAAGPETSTEPPPSRKGANSAPLLRPTQARAEAERVQDRVIKGATAVAPAIEPQEPSVIPPNPPLLAKGGAGRSANASSPSPGPTPAPPEPKPKPKPKPAGPAGPLTLRAWLERCKAAGEPAFAADDPVFAYAATAGIAPDLVALQWAEFKALRIDTAKRQADWRRAFRNSVRGNWYKLWFIAEGQPAQLTTTGRQARAAFEAQRAAEHARGAGA